MSVVLRRLIALLALAFTAAYLLPGWLAADGLPVGVVLAWLAALAGAAIRPSASWLLFVAAAPLLPIVPTLREWPAVPLLALWLSALLVPAYGRLLVRPGRSWFDPWAGLFLLLVTASLVAALAPFAVGAGARDLLARLHGFMTAEFATLESQRHLFASTLAWAIVAEGVAMGWLARRFLRERGEAGLVQMAVAAVTGAGLVAAWGVRQWWTREHLLPFWREFDPFIVRINASFTDVNTLGSYLAAMAVVSLSLAGAARDARARAAGLVVTALVVTALVFTASRVAWGAMAVGGAIYAALAWRLGARPAPASLLAAHGRRAAASAVLVLALLFAGLTAYATAIDARHTQQRSYLDTVLHTLNLRVSPADKLKGRLPLWGAAWRMVEARPLTGIGVGRYYKDVSLYAAEDAALIRPQENAHNYFLQLAAECGLPTLAAWLLMISLAASSSWCAAREAGPPVRHLVCGGIGGLAAFLLTCVTGHPLLLREGQYAFWMVLSIAGGAALLREERGHGVRPWIAAASLLVLASLPWRVMAEVGSVDLSRVPRGVYEVEEAPDGTTFRWTHARATFYLPADSQRVEFSVRTVAPLAQDVDVLLGGQRVERLRLDDHAWRTLRYELPKAAPQAYVELVLDVRPAWRADNDPRELGVMVRDLSFSR